MTDTPQISLDPNVTAIGQLAFGAPLALYFIRAHWQLVNEALPKAVKAVQDELRAHRAEMARNAERIALAMHRCPAKELLELKLPARSKKRPRQAKKPARKRRSPRQGG